MQVPDRLVALQYLEGKPGVWRDCVVVEIQVDWPEVLLAHLLSRATWGRLSMGEKVEKHPEHSKLYFCAHQSTCPEERSLEKTGVMVWLEHSRHLVGVPEAVKPLTINKRRLLAKLIFGFLRFFDSSCWSDAS